MTRKESLKQLERVLANFLDRAVAMKGERLAVLEGVSQLDNIARSASSGFDTTDDLGRWLADSNHLLETGRLQPSDYSHIDKLISDIQREYRPDDSASAEAVKIKAELNRWQDTARKATRKIVLKRGPETAPETGPLTPVDPSDTIAGFTEHLDRMNRLWKDLSGRGKHVMSVLDDALVSARVQKRRDALILSAYIIYYLKLRGYKVEPYIKRLRDAEKALQWEGSDA